jgi:peptidyl-prolyl cis-trans isomerase SurA
VFTGRARAVVCAAIFAAAPPTVRAQQDEQLVDRIVAVVGQQPILLSQIQEEILLRQANGQLQVPADSAGRAALRRQVLESMIDDEVLYQRARRDTSIVVSDADVQIKVDEQAQRIRAQFRSEPEFRNQIAAVGFGTPEEWRRWLGDNQRRQEYHDRYLQKLQEDGKLKPANVSEAEMRRAFTDILQGQAQRPKRPATVSFRQIVVAPQPSPAARAAALVKAESILAQVRRGADFETMARRFSEDPGTKERGGDLGWFRRGMMVQAFDRAAFSLRPGEISDIVVSPFGYHIIKVDRVQPAEVKAFHILITPAVDSTNIAVAAARADTVVAALRAGASIDSLAKLYADTSEQTQAGPVQRSQLPPSYAAAFDSAAVGQILDPFPTDPDSPSRSKYVIAMLTDVQPERDYTFDDVRDQMRRNLGQEKAVKELLRSLRSQTYIDNRL